MTSPADFDPYAQWLGIQPHEHPIDHYRLLGIARFESNTDVISEAADQRMIQIRSFQTGPRGQHTQRLLNEMSAARICLLDPNTKVTYDAVLKGNFSATSAPPAPPPASPPPIAQSPESAAQPPSLPQPASPPPPVEGFVSGVRPAGPAQYHKQRWFPIAALLGVVVIAGFVWGIGMAMSNRPVTGEMPQPLKNGRPANDQVEPPTVNPADVNGGATTLQDSSGNVSFDMSRATIHGSSLRYDEANGVITDWKSTDDWLSWQFKVVKRGYVRVELKYAARADGGRIKVSVGDQSISRNVRMTNTGQFVTDEFQFVLKKSGQQTLELRAVEIPGDELLVLESIEFRAK